MPFKYKINYIELLKDKGYKELNNHFGGADLQKMRKGIVVGINTLHRLCELLELQPGDIIEYISDDENK